MRVTIGGGSYLIATADKGVTYVDNDDPSSGEGYLVGYGNAFDPTGIASLNLSSPASPNPIPPFTSDALPIAGFDPTVFANRYMQLQFTSVTATGSSSAFVVASLNSVDRVGDVPLPAAAWLLLSGLGGLGVMARRRRVAAV